MSKIDNLFSDIDESYLIKIFIPRIRSIGKLNILRQNQSTLLMIVADTLLCCVLSFGRTVIWFSDVMSTVQQYQWYTIVVELSDVCLIQRLCDSCILFHDAYVGHFTILRLSYSHQGRFLWHIFIFIDANKWVTTSIVSVTLSTKDNSDYCSKRALVGRETPSVSISAESKKHRIDHVHVRVLVAFSSVLNFLISSEEMTQCDIEDISFLSSLSCVAEWKSFSMTTRRIAALF